LKKIGFVSGFWNPTFPGLHGLKKTNFFTTEIERFKHVTKR